MNEPRPATMFTQAELEAIEAEDVAAQERLAASVNAPGRAGSPHPRREALAAAAVTGILASCEASHGGYRDADMVAEVALDIADALMRAIDRDGRPLTYGLTK